jgi:hypothetical protein
MPMADQIECFVRTARPMAVAVSLSLWLAGCGSADAAPSGSADGGGHDGGETQPWGRPLQPRPATSIDEVPLVTTVDDGVADVQVVPILFEGQDAWLALDTGSPLTFLFSDPAGPQYVEEAGTVLIGTQAWTLPGYREDAIGVEYFDARPILGILGIDYFADHPTELDYPGGRIVRWLEGTPSLAGSSSVGLHGLEHDRPLVDVILDDTPLTLMLDAGAHDTIWLGVIGDADDEVAAVQTADGEVWEVYVGDGALAFPEEPERLVPVLRALDIGYIKPELDEIGAQGLLGLTSLGWRRVVFDFAAGELALFPISDP